MESNLNALVQFLSMYGTPLVITLVTVSYITYVSRLAVAWTNENWAAYRASKKAESKRWYPVRGIEYAVDYLFTEGDSEKGFKLKDQPIGLIGSLATTFFVGWAFLVISVVKHIILTIFYRPFQLWAWIVRRTHNVEIEE